MFKFNCFTISVLYLSFFRLFFMFSFLTSFLKLFSYFTLTFLRLLFFIYLLNLSPLSRPFFPLYLYISLCDNIRSIFIYWTNILSMFFPLFFLLLLRILNILYRYPKDFENNSLSNFENISLHIYKKSFHISFSLSHAHLDFITSSKHCMQINKNIQMDFFMIFYCL